MTKENKVLQTLRNQKKTLEGILEQERDKDATSDSTQKLEKQLAELDEAIKELSAPPAVKVAVSQPKSAPNSLSKKNKDKSLNISVAALVVSLFALLMSLLPGVGSSNPTESNVENNATQTSTPTPEPEQISSDAPWTEVIGADFQKYSVVAVNDGEVVADPNIDDYNEVVEVYIDYACSFCKQWEEQFAEIDPSEVTDTLFVFHLLGFLDTPESQFSTYAASVSANIAVNEPGKWLEVHQAFFNIGDVYGEEDIVTFLTEQGITSPEILADPAALDSQVYVEAVNSHSGEVIERGVTGTPTVIVNGVKLENGFEYFS